MDESQYQFNDPAIDQYVNPPGDFNGGLDNSQDSSGGETLPGPDVQNAAANDTSALPDGSTKMHTLGLPDAAAPDDGTTPGGAQISQFPNPGQSLPTDASVIDGQTAAGVPDSQFPASRSQGSSTDLAPSEIAAINGKPGYTTDSTAPSAPTPNLPNSGATSAPSAPSSAPSGAGAPGQTSDAQWQQDFQKANGFFNNSFDARQNFLDNAQRGDMVIRGFDSTGQRTGPDQLAEMAKYDSDAKRILDTINATPDFYRSQNTADWIGAHNTQIANDFAQGGGGLTAGGAGAGGAGFNGALGAPPARGSGNGYVTSNGQNLLSQRIPDIANPIDNAHALMTDQMRTGVQDALTSLGATNIKQNIDPYGNLTLDWVSRSGTPMSMKESLVNYANALEQLKGMAAPPTANPAAGGGGGYPPRTAAPRSNFAPPRGGGGGYAPPQAPSQAPAAQGQPGPFAYPNINGQSSLAVNDPAFQNQGRPQPAIVSPQIATMRNNGQPVPY